MLLKLFKLFQSYTKFVGYLATQLPLPDTKVDFWTMVKDHSSSTIVLILNDQKEVHNTIHVNIIFMKIFDF
jgi:protein tyrosine phosphatase